MGEYICLAWQSTAWQNGIYYYSIINPGGTVTHTFTRIPGFNNVNNIRKNTTINILYGPYRWCIFMCNNNILNLGTDAINIIMIYWKPINNIALYNMPPTTTLYNLWDNINDALTAGITVNNNYPTIHYDAASNAVRLIAMVNSIVTTPITQPLKILPALKYDNNLLSLHGYTVTPAPITTINQ